MHYDKPRSSYKRGNNKCSVQESEEQSWRDSRSRIQCTATGHRRKTIQWPVWNQDGDKTMKIVSCSLAIYTVHSTQRRLGWSKWALPLLTCTIASMCNASTTELRRLRWWKRIHSAFWCIKCIPGAQLTSFCWWLQQPTPTWPVVSSSPSISKQPTLRSSTNKTKFQLKSLASRSQDHLLGAIYPLVSKNNRILRLHKKLLNTFLLQLYTIDHYVIRHLSLCTRRRRNDAFVSYVCIICFICLRIIHEQRI